MVSSTLSRSSIWASETLSVVWNVFLLEDCSFNWREHHWRFNVTLSTIIILIGHRSSNSFYSVNSHCGCWRILMYTNKTSSAEYCHSNALSPASSTQQYWLKEAECLCKRHDGVISSCLFLSCVCSHDQPQPMIVWLENVFVLVSLPVL